MGYKQSPGRKNMPKTGRGIDSATLMTGSPAKQSSQRYWDKGRSIKRNVDGTAPLKPDGGSSYGNQLLGHIPAARGQLYVRPDGREQFPDNRSEQSIMDMDNDGDTIMNDSNDDGTMLSRAAKAISKAITE